MALPIFPVGSRVQVISDSPFRDLRGTIRRVHTMQTFEGDEPFCYYWIELEGASIKEPIWFTCDEVEAVALILAREGSSRRSSE